MINIQGKNCVVQLNLASVWTDILCGDDFTVNYNPEFILKTGPNSPARERQPRIEDWAVSVSGITELANSARVSWFYLMQEAVRRSLLDIRIKFVDDAATTKTMQFSAYVGQSTITGPVADFCNATLNFEVSGGITDLSNPIDPVAPGTLTLLADWWATVNGNAFINGASSGSTDGTNYTLNTGDLVKQVAVEGLIFDIVPGAPTAGTNQCQMDLTNHKIIFPITFDGSQTVYVEWER